MIRHTRFPVDKRLHVLLVARNEAGRYLSPVLEAVPAPWIFLFDDRSTDETVEVAKEHGAMVAIRPECVPSFREHEGAFRQAAWDAFEQKMKPQVGEWVLALDCDEFLVADDLPYALGMAMEQPCDGIEIPIYEVWNWGSHPMVRIDGWWGSIRGLRLFRYKTGGVFKSQPMACGSAPTYVDDSVSFDHCGLSILHLGYMHPSDREVKYRRYSRASGHNPYHVDSILRVPHLEQWKGPIPDIDLGEL